MSTKTKKKSGVVLGFALASTKGMIFNHTS